MGASKVNLTGLANLTTTLDINSLKDSGSIRQGAGRANSGLDSSGNLTGTMTIGSNITLDASNNRILITD